VISSPRGQVNATTISSPTVMLMATTTLDFNHDKARDFAVGSSVMTLSLGGAHRFQLQHKTTKEKQELLLLEHDDIWEGVFDGGPRARRAGKVMERAERMD
jgi:hypothetical protein